MLVKRILKTIKKVAFDIRKDGNATFFAIRRASSP